MLLVGLGNPGEKYRFTRHNMGFMVLDAFAKRHAFPDFKLGKKPPALVSEDFIEHQKIVLAKPQTLMNSSGLVVKSLTKNYRLKTTDLIVIHDDIDLPLGKIKVSFGRGSAGHKGVDSIIRHLKTKNFTRIRIGIQPKAGKPKALDAFVLKKFLREEREPLHSAIQQACLAIETLGNTK